MKAVDVSMTTKNVCYKLLTLVYISICKYMLLPILLFYPTDAQLDYSKRLSKFTLKCSCMFQFNNHHQGATIRALLKL